MIEKLKKILAGIDADYADIRYEIKSSNRAIMSSREIRNAGSNSGDGFVVRILKNGGLASVGFTGLEDAGEAIKSALENALLLAANQNKPVIMAPAPVVKDSFKQELNEDPRNIPLKEKVALIKHYSYLLFSQPKVVEVGIHYEDVIREKYFVNSEGSEIFEELVTSVLVCTVTCQEGEITQSVNFSFGGSDGFAKVRNRDNEAVKQAKLAAELLNAEPVKAGTYQVILDPTMTGLFVHEAFGHYSEADSVSSVPSIREKLPLGAKLGNEILNIVDDATIPNQIGFYKYDDEGVAVKRVNIMTNGVLTGRLHSRSTSTEFNEPLTGHNIAEDYCFAPIVRMGNTFIVPGKSTFEDLLKQMDNGLYLYGAGGGVTVGENYTFSSQCGYKVENGKITGMVKGVNMCGNLFETLHNITGVANDFGMKEVGGCGKEGQINIRNNSGGPHILITKVTIGGV